MAPKRSLASFLYVDASSRRDAELMDRMKQQNITPVRTDTALPKFTIVVGPSPFSMPRGWEFFLAAPYEGATYIATVLHNAGYPTTIVDVRYTPDPLNTAYRQIEAAGTDVLGICTYEDNFPFCRELMSMVRRRRPNIPIILGGSLVTSVPEVMMNHTQADIAVISEGELTILELMESYARGSWERDLPHIRGIWYRGDEGQLVATPPRGQMPDLDSLPFMRLDLWPQAQSERGLQPQIITSYSRGCKMDCSFCYRTTPQVRAKSPEKFDQDLAWLKSEYDIDFAFFVDLTFSSRRDQTIEMCDVIKDHDLRWTCLTRCADVDKPRLDAMRESGADIILYGVESLGANILKEARKGNSKNISVRAMQLTNEAGIRPGALLIVGLPGESEESLDEVCTWAEEHNQVTRVKYLSAMPGTTVYQQALAEGVIRSEIEHLNWLSIEQALEEDEFLNTNGLPEQAVRTAYKRIYDAYQPGPVMDFQHFPEHFEYHAPNHSDGKDHCVEYAGPSWRGQHSSCTAPLVPGSERFTLDKMGTPKATATGASLMECGAKRMADTADSPGA